MLINKIQQHETKKGNHNKKVNDFHRRFEQRIPQHR